jgi:hypothetical protein
MADKAIWGSSSIYFLLIIVGSGERFEAPSAYYRKHGVDSALARFFGFNPPSAHSKSSGSERPGYCATNYSQGVIRHPRGQVCSFHFCAIFACPS